ncbi:hypothetical protein BDV41DRAFT_524043, partial [Aspergillus transmontanensis]
MFMIPFLFGSSLLSTLEIFFFFFFPSSFLNFLFSLIFFLNFYFILFYFTFRVSLILFSF